MAKYAKARQELGAKMARIGGPQGVGAGQVRALATLRPHTPKRPPVKCKLDPSTAPEIAKHKRPIYSPLVLLFVWDLTENVGEKIFCIIK